MLEAIEGRLALCRAGIPFRDNRQRDAMGDDPDLFRDCFPLNVVLSAT